MWSGVAVAVKTFHEDPVRVDELNISFIRREVSVSSRVHHPNVVSICGAIAENEVPLRIVMELLEGSLKDVIKAALKRRYLSMREQVDIAVGCLCGVMYLHQLQPALLHGDIRSTNILISKTMEAKIGDLGSCRFSNESLSVGPLSPQYIAPERVVEGHELWKVTQSPHPTQHKPTCIAWESRLLSYSQELLQRGNCVKLSFKLFLMFHCRTFAMLWQKRIHVIAFLQQQLSCK